MSAESFGAANNRTIHGSMKKGEMIRIVCRTPYKTGKVKHPSALSPATSEKSFVTEAPNRYKANIPPSTQASTNPLSWSHENTSSIAVDAAVERSRPRAIDIAKDAVTAFAFSLPNAGKEYDVVIRAAKEITNDLLNLFFCCMLFHIRVIGVAEN